MLDQWLQCCPPHAAGERMTCGRGRATCRWSRPRRAATWVSGRLEPPTHRGRAHRAGAALACGARVSVLSVQCVPARPARWPSRRRRGPGHPVALSTRLGCRVFSLQSLRRACLDAPRICRPGGFLLLQLLLGSPLTQRPPAHRPASHSLASRRAQGVRGQHPARHQRGRDPGHLQGLWPGAPRGLPLPGPVSWVPAQQPAAHLPRLRPSLSARSVFLSYPLLFFAFRRSSRSCWPPSPFLFNLAVLSFPVFCFLFRRSSRSCWRVTRPRGSPRAPPTSGSSAAATQTWPVSLCCFERVLSVPCSVCCCLCLVPALPRHRPSQ